MQDQLFPTLPVEVSAASRFDPGDSPGRNVFCLDWRHGKQAIALNGELWEDVYYEGDLIDFLREHALPLAPDVAVYLEQSFESFYTARRNEVIRFCDESGISLRVVQSRFTGHERSRRGLRDEKSDGLDALMIWEIARSGRHWKRPVVMWDGDDGEDRRAAVELRRRDRNRRLQSLRDSNYGNADAWRLREVLELARGDCPQEFRWVIWPKGKMRDTFALSVALAAETVATEGDVLTGSRGRDGFERETGLYGHGYPGIVRSNIYYHTLPFVWGQMVGWTKDDDESRRDAMGQDREGRKAAERTIRKAARWIFRTVKASRTNPAQQGGQG